MKNLVRVVYWAGTTQREAEVPDYAAAMRVASLNQNASQPTFWELSTGKQLFDDGNGLCYEDRSVYAC